MTHKETNTEINRYYTHKTRTKKQKQKKMQPVLCRNPQWIAEPRKEKREVMTVYIQSNTNVAVNL